MARTRDVTRAISSKVKRLEDRLDGATLLGCTAVQLAFAYVVWDFEPWSLTAGLVLGFLPGWQLKAIHGRGRFRRPK